MTTKAKRVCAVCGNFFLASSEFCPVCALRAGLGGDHSISESATGLAISQLRCEHYEILTREDGTPLELGRGAMGVTYKACDINLRRAVALKVINAKFVSDKSANRRLIREARAAASLRHPNVASVFHLGRSGDSYFYAMEFVDGESLDKLIRSSGRLEPSTALKLATLVAAGLEAIHKQNLVHGDIKPSNTMVSLQGDKIVNAKIIDLGLAKGNAADNGSISEISVEGSFAGTPQYASPEQFGGVGRDIRSDLYSLGITLWEMLAGQVPFQGSISELIYQHQHATLPVDKLTHIAQPVIALLEILLEKDPARRLQTPTELLDAIPRVIAALDEGRSLTADQLRLRTDEAAESRGRDRGLSAIDRRALGWLIAILAVSGLLLGWLFFSGHGRQFFDRQGAQTAPTEKSIAVLPFENISANKDDTYFADGVQDEILNNLAKIAQLRVISRTSVMQYRTDTKRDLRQIATALGVSNVLEGTVRRDGNRVRVSTELIDARNDHTIWADSYDRDLTDIFTIQSDVAQTIASKLTATLSPEQIRSIEERPTDNLEAYDLYLRAKELLIRVRLSSSLGTVQKPLRDAAGFLEQAVRLDPKFTLAYCASAEAQDFIYYWYDPTLERRGLAEAAVNSALRLQPDLAEAHLAKARHLYFGYRDYDRAREELAIARRYLPNDSDAILFAALIDRRQGNFERAIQEFNKAITRDPLNSVSIEQLASSLYVTRQFRAAQEAYGRLIELRPEQPILRVQKAVLTTFLKTGDDTAFWSEVAALPIPMDDDRGVLSLRLSFALVDRDWPQAEAIIEKMRGGEDEGYFAYGEITVPVGCYSILLARLQGKQENSKFAEVREQLNQKVQKSPNANLLSQLAVVDALLNNKETAISEARRAIEILPISKDALDGPRIVTNSAVVYAWANELDLAFETLSSSVKTPSGICYGQLKRDPYWDPLRKDPRFDKLLAELAPVD